MSESILKYKIYAHLTENKIPLLMEIEFDKQISNAMVKKKSIIEVARNSDISLELRSAFKLISGLKTE